MGKQHKLCPGIYGPIHLIGRIIDNGEEEMELNPIVKQALEDIDFIERYQRLSDEYSAEKVPSEERLVYVDGDEVFEMLSKLGYESSLDNYQFC